MVKPKHLIVSTLLSLAASSLASAGEQSALHSDVPVAVSQAVASRYPTGERVQFAKQVGRGKTMYSVELAVLGAATKLCVAPTGGVELEQQAIAPASLPESVQRSLIASGFKTDQVILAQRVTRPEHQSLARYDLLIGFHGSRHELTFDGTGDLVLDARSSSCIGEPGPAPDRIASLGPTRAAQESTRT